jgi:all-trans-8'-apo-beta-carotenal 15,15'-oxygenase
MALTRHLSRREALSRIGSNATFLTLTAAPKTVFAKSDPSQTNAFSKSFELPLGMSLETPDINIKGKLPADLNGMFYRNGPARFKLGPTEYEHWFDGDGMVQAFNFFGGKLSHKGVLLRTPKLVEEQAAGRFLYSGFGTEIANSRKVRSPDQLNVANINLLAMNEGRELYALWEGGSALEIEPNSLAAKTFKVWSEETAGAAFSAHPRAQLDGTVWSFGYASHSGKLIIYEIDKSGKLKRQALIDAPQADMVHDFAITSKYLIFLLMPLSLKPNTQSVGSLERFVWNDAAPLITLVVSKSDFSIKRYELPNGGVFHLGNAWENGSVIHLHYARYSKFLSHLKSLTLPSPRVPLEELAEWYEVEVDLQSNRIRQAPVGLQGIEFPSFDKRLTGERTDVTVLMQNTHATYDTRYGSDRVLSIQNDKIDGFSYGENWIAEEHLLVKPRSSASSDIGWVLGTALNKTTLTTTLSVFRASHLADGPVAQCALPYALPLGLHGQFVERV